MSNVSSVILIGNTGDRPTDNSSGKQGRLFLAIDDQIISRDNGTTWDEFPLGGGGGGGGAPAPREWIHFHFMSVATNGNGINRGVASDQFFNFIANQDTPADADVFTFEVALKAGDYTLEVYGKKGDNCGILDVQLEGDDVAMGLDFYSPTDDADQVITQTDFSTAIDGQQKFTCTVNGHNGASSDYKIPITYISCKPRYA